MGQSRLSRRTAVGVMAVATASVLLVSCSSSGSDASSTAATEASSAASAPAASASAAPSEAAGSSAPAVAAGDPYVIGNLIEVQTPFGTYPENYQGTVTAWESWTNEHGGINGHPVKVISIDTKADAAKTLSAAQQLVEQEGAIALAGLVIPSTETAIQEYVDAAGVPVVGSAYSSIAAKDPNWFQTAASSYEVTGYSRALAAQENGVTDYGIMYCTEVPACETDMSTQVTAAEQLGAPKIATTIPAAIASPNFTAPCVQLKQANVNGIYFSSSVAGIARAAVDCARQGIKAVHIMGESGPELLDTKQIWENGAGGADMSVPYWADVPEAADYHAAMEAWKPGTELSAASAQVWASLQILKGALETVPDEPMTSETVKKGLYSLPADYHSDMSVPVTYKEGEPSVVKCFVMWAIADGAYKLTNGTNFACQP